MVDPAPSFRLIRPVQSGRRGSSARGIWPLIAAGFGLGAIATLTLTPRSASSMQDAAVLPGLTAESGPAGLIVTSVRDGSGAQQAGIAPGDLVTTLDGKPINRLRDAENYLTHDRNDIVRLSIVHDGQSRMVSLGRPGSHEWRTRS